MIKYYKVGGFVRDQILGVKSKDIDYAVEAPSFDYMVKDVTDRGGEIFLQKPEYQTIRAKLNGEAADFVLCRKESFYTDGRHPDSVTIGTIDDDLARRDFTMNAIAIDESGNYYDPHGGVYHIKSNVIKCVGNPYERFKEDSLRMIRAIRFCITKGMMLDNSIRHCLNDDNLIQLIDNISKERIREELYKCFKHNSYETMEIFCKDFEDLGYKIFQNKDLWLQPTFLSR